MDARDAKIHVPGSLTTIVIIKTGGNREYADGSEWGRNLTKNAAKADGQGGGAGVDGSPGICGCEGAPQFSRLPPCVGHVIPVE